jgi:hypothetical protein
MKRTFTLDENELLEAVEEWFLKHQEVNTTRYQLKITLTREEHKGGYYPQLSYGATITEEFRVEGKD